MSKLAEEKGFEPLAACAAPVFKTCSVSMQVRVLATALGWSAVASACVEAFDDQPAEAEYSSLGDAPRPVPESLTLAADDEADPLASSQLARRPLGGWSGAWCFGAQRLELYPSGLAIGVRPGSWLEGAAWLQGDYLALEWHAGPLVWMETWLLTSDGEHAMVLLRGNRKTRARRCYDAGRGEWEL